MTVASSKSLFKYTKSQVLDCSVWKILPLPNSVKKDCSKCSAHLLPRFEDMATLVKQSTNFAPIASVVPEDQQSLAVQFMDRITGLAPSESVYACIVSMSLVLEENKEHDNATTPWWSINNNEVKKDDINVLKHEEKTISWCTEEEREMIYEAWTFVQEKSTWGMFSTFYAYIRESMHISSIPHPLVQYVQTILPNLHKKADVDLVQKLFDIQTPQNPTNTITNSGGGGGGGGNPVLFLQQQIVDVYESKPVMFAILINPPSWASSMDANNSLSIHEKGRQTLQLTHSCCPNASLDVVIETTNAPKVSLVMLDSIEQEEDLTVAMVDNTGSYIQRTKTLEEQRFPRKTQEGQKQATTACDCWRCLTDCDKSVHLHPPLRNAIRLGHLAMQQGRYEDARKWYTYVTKEEAKDNKYDGDVWHALGAAYLQEQRFLKAQQCWRDQVENHASLKNHAGIALQLEKQKAYRYFRVPSEDAVPTFSNYQEIYKGLCFVTKDPVMDSTECKQVIQWAEENMDGWTTSRHYAVPTTDVPVHTVPSLVQWFMNLMETKVCPLLSRQFASSCGNKRWFVHDAFIVRYEATMSNNHLPLHVDESTHSFVLALNDNYKGGATYFVDYDETHTLSTGNLLSFRGDSLRHGGNVVTEGTRYILAAFLYFENVSSSSSSGTVSAGKSPRAAKDEVNDGMPQPPSSKKCKMLNLFQEQKTQQDDASFSFGFTL